jgi:DNA invertase Pin-like site-specific DNA recombinase
MKVTCHRDDREHAADAGHLVVTGDPDAIFFHETPDDETIENLVEHSTLPVIIHLDGCTAAMDFETWASGFFAHRARHIRRTKAGVHRAMVKGYSPKRYIPAKTEYFVRSLLEMSIPMKTIARKTNLDVKTVRRVRDDMEKK